MVDAVDAVEVSLDRAEACALVDRLRADVEGRDGERERGCAELLPREVHPSLHKGETETVPGQVWSQAEPDLERRDLVLELEEADQVAGNVDDLEVPAATEVRAEEIGEVGIVRDGVVEVVG